MLSDLDRELSNKDLYAPVAVRELVPSLDRCRVHELIDDLIHEGEVCALCSSYWGKQAQSALHLEGRRECFRRGSHPQMQ